MAVTANTILDAVVAAVATDFSSGESGIDMSVTGRVIEGEYRRPQVTGACAAVSPPSITRAEEILNLAQWGRRLTCVVGVWAPSADSNNNRRNQVLELASDIGNAIEGTKYRQSDFYTGSLASVDIAYIAVEIDVVDGMEEGMTPGYAHAMLTVTVEYQKGAGY